MAQVISIRNKKWLALLAVLFVVVLIVHLFLLEAASGRFNITTPNQTTAFSTRQIELPVIQPPSAAPMVKKPPTMATPPKTPTTPKAVKPKTEPAQEIAQTPAELPKPLPTIEPNNATTASSEVTAEAKTDPQPATERAPSNAAADGPGISGEAAGSAASDQSSQAGLPPPAFTAMNSGLHTYKVIFTKNSNSNQGKALIRWQQDGERYALDMTASMLFIDVFKWGSTGLMSTAGLKPERFSDKRYRKSEVATHFDRVQNKIIFSTNKPEAVLFDGAQDRISVIWQIAGMLSADPKRFPPGNMFSLQTVSATDAEPWLFSVNEPETLNLESGSQIALRLTRNPRREFDQKIELWFAPALNYLPARFRFTESNGDYVDVVWQSVDNIPNVLTR